MTEITEEEAKDEVKTAPPKRWRNKWRAKEYFITAEDGERRCPGDEFFGPNVRPSKEVAEAKATEIATRWPQIEWLGPFPVQEPSP